MARTLPHQKNHNIPSFPELTYCFGTKMDESISSISSISLLEKAGLNTLLPPYESPENIQRLIAVLETRTSELPGFLRRFQRWVDLSEREIDAGQPSNEDLRLTFQVYEHSASRKILEVALMLCRCSEAISDHIAALSELLQVAYRGILVLQRDKAVNRDLVAWIHDDLERATFDVVHLAELWLNLRTLS